MKIRELRVTYHARPDAPHYSATSKIADARQAAAIFTPMLKDQAQEVFLCLYMNTKGRVIGIQEIGRGSLDSVIASPRIIVRSALLVDAASIIVAHNHPSGDPTPSPQDIDMTKRLRDAAKLLEIELVDHVIISEGSFRSLKEWGIL